MVLETKRLLLRRWEDADASDLFAYAKDPDVGPIAGWPAHTSVDESLAVIRGVLGRPETFAICLKETCRPIGSIGLHLTGDTDLTDAPDECEMGYWLGKPFWGSGIMTEAAREMLRHAFQECGMSKVWIGYYDGNERSHRVQQKCGFRYQWTTPDVDVPLMHETRVGHVSCLTREQWEWDALYRAAKAVQDPRTVSDHVEAGGVAAAIMSASGRVYTGVCVDTACSLGLCAERTALFNMLTCGEHEVRKVLAIMPDGRTGAPCGACRELLVQLMPQRYGEIQIMLDYESEKVVALGELTPHWWI